MKAKKLWEFEKQDWMILRLLFRRNTPKINLGDEGNHEDVTRAYKYLRDKYARRAYDNAVHNLIIEELYTCNN
jgi:hypothetical protein